MTEMCLQTLALGLSDMLLESAERFPTQEARAEYPEAIPSLVREYVRLRLDGDEGGAKGSAELNTSFQKDFESAVLKVYILQPHFLHFGRGLLKSFIENLEECFDGVLAAEEGRESKEKTLAQLYKEITLLLRLIDPDLMGEVYERLREELNSEREIVDFIEAAERGAWDFKEFRSIQKRSTVLFERIGKQARQLARLVRELRSLGVLLPAELRPLRHRGEVALSGETKEAFHLNMLRLLEDLECRPQSTRKSGSLDLSDALFKVASVSEEWSSDLGCPVAEAALHTREISVKTSYIRAFGALIRKAQIEITPGVRQAMAMTANVVLEDPDLSISEDDVRKALKRPGPWSDA